MTVAEREQLRRAILSKISELRQIMDTDAKDAEAIELDQARVGRLARMDAVQHHAIAKAQAEKAGIQYNQLQLILTRVDDLEDLDLGECLECGEDIGLGRMLIRPESVYCVRCAE